MTTGYGWMDAVIGDSCTDSSISWVKSPNQVIPSCTMRHWNGRTPGVRGAVTVKLNTADEPGGISCGTSTLPRPQTALSCGFCEPSRCGLDPAEVQVVIPVFFMVMLTGNECPASTGDGGALWLTKRARCHGITAV